MQPAITLIRVRQDGVPVLHDASFLHRFGDPSKAQFLELPYPAKHSARDFALDFFDAVSKARGEWIHVCCDDSAVNASLLLDTLRQLEAARMQDMQGAVWSGRVKHADGKETRLFADGFSLDALESGKAEHPCLVETQWLLSLFVFKTAFARSLAEEWVRTPDPLPAVLGFVAAAKVAAALQQGMFLSMHDVALPLSVPRTPEQIASGAMADFEANRSEASLRALDHLRLTHGANPGIDLHRCVLNAKLERFWLAGYMVKRFLQKNKGNAPGVKLSEAIATRKASSPMGYAAAEPLLREADEDGAFAGEKRLFELVNGLHDQAVIVEIGEFPLRSSLAMALAAMGTAKKVHTLSHFRAREGWKASAGRGSDIWKAAVNHLDVEDFAEASADPREKLRAWGEAPRPDVIYVSIHSENDFREEIAQAFALLKEGGYLIVEGADASRPAAWKFWAELAEPALAEKGRDGILAFGRKTSAPLGGAKPPATFPELWRRFHLPEPYERTMLSFERLRNAFTLSRTVDIRKVEGAIVECGVWKGGCSASMLLAAQETGSKRHLWAFDSFQGLPRPTEKDGAWAFEKSDEWGGAGCEATEEDFRETLFQIAGLKNENVHMRKGWFKDTLPTGKHEIGPIAILRLDGDWYESVLVCLEHLYDLVVPGGYILIDDYGYWEGAQKATDEFRAKRGIRSPLILTDHDERYWIKLDEKESWKPGAAVGETALKLGGTDVTGKFP